jgi:hypothetical protein
MKREIAAAKPKTDAIYYKGLKITPGGFAAAEMAYRSHDETADIGSSYSKMPYNNDKAGRTGSTTFTGRQSRYSALIQGDADPQTHLSFYGEFDFLGAAQTANSNESNSYQPRVRNLYGAVDWDNGWHILAGQNWSLATMNTKGITPRNEAPPPTIEAQYVPGFVWARQAQVRVTKDFGKVWWVAVSLENPQTTFGGTTTTAGGVSITTTQAPTSQFFSGTNYSLNDIPDVIAKVAYENSINGHQVHAEAFGIMRSYLDRVNIAATGSNNSERSTGGGGGAGLSVQVIPKALDVQVSGMGGNGIGRYGSGQLSDVTVQPNGHLVGIPEVMWLAGATFHATPQLDLYVFGGQERENKKLYAIGATTVGYGVTPASNAGCAIEGGSCSAITKSIQQVTAGLWDKVYTGPFGQLRVGLQYSHTEKDAYADKAGYAPVAKEDMIFTSFRYYPF